MDRIFLPIQKSVFLAASREGYTQRELAKKFALPMTTINNWMSRVDLMRRLVNELSRSNSEAESRGGGQNPGEGGIGLVDLRSKNCFMRLKEIGESPRFTMTDRGNCWKEQQARPLLPISISSVGSSGKQEPSNEFRSSSMCAMKSATKDKSTACAGEGLARARAEIARDANLTAPKRGTVSREKGEKKPGR